MSLYKMGKIISSMDKPYDNLDNIINDFQKSIIKFDINEKLKDDLLNISNNMNKIIGIMRYELDIIDKSCENLDKLIIKR